MILSYKMIDEIATSIFANISKTLKAHLDLIPIEDIAQEHLKLNVTYTKLSDDGSVLGLTAYADTQCSLMLNGEERIINLKNKQILLDDVFIQPNERKKLIGKHRFTLAHEVAHQILFGLESIEKRVEYEKMYSKRSSYTAKQLKTKEDWNEWQANVLGAALLMPINAVKRIMNELTSGHPLVNYYGWFVIKHKEALKQFCEYFRVSRTAAIIRLRQLGYIHDKGHYEYIDPLVVVYEEL